MLGGGHVKLAFICSCFARHISQCHAGSAVHTSVFRALSYSYGRAASYAAVWRRSDAYFSSNVERRVLFVGLTLGWFLYFTSQ